MQKPTHYPRPGQTGPRYPYTPPQAMIADPLPKCGDDITAPSREDSA